jgi:hypothetical protein
MRPPTTVERVDVDSWLAGEIRSGRLEAALDAGDLAQVAHLLLENGSVGAHRPTNASAPMAQIHRGTPTEDRRRVTRASALASG